jgi:hypothetical protein
MKSFVLTVALLAAAPTLAAQESHTKARLVKCDGVLG